MSALAAPTHSPYEQHRAYVLSVLNRRCRWLDHGDREAALHDAYLVLLQKQHDGELDVAAMHDQQVRAYLVQTAIHKALDEGKRAGRQRERALDEALAWPDHGISPDEQAVAGQTSAQIREVVSELPERQGTIVKLRFFFDRTPDEIQDYLDVSERVYRRELERALRQISSSVELVREDRFCESRRSAILALVAGISGPGRARDARAHLASCPACARWAVELREAAGRAAAVLPLPALGATHWSDRLARMFEVVGEQLSVAKQHVIATATRLDPSSAGYAAAARPGALAAAVAGCISVGSGATYCVVEGIPDPLRAPLLSAIAKPPPEQRRTAPSRVHADATAAPPRTLAAPPIPVHSTAVAPAPAKPKPKPKPKSVPRPATAPSTQTAAATQEFGVEGSGQTVTGGGTSASSAAAQPAPAPTPAPTGGGSGGGGGEFDP